MSGFEEYKKISKNEPIIVNDNNAQKQINNMNGLLDQERDKGVEINKSPYDYDPDQLLEHFKQRTADDTDEAFNLRTKYYFQDDDYMTAKARRYQKINQRGENRGKLESYSNRYTYHKAKNRQYAAETASIKFADARDKQQRYKNDGDEDSLTQYKHRKEIMQDRMSAMESVAYVKAQNKKHEKYLIGRSRLSGNMILKDQLDHFITKEAGNAQMVRALNRELAKVESEIKKATKIVVDNVPKAQDKWRDANRLNNARYTQKMNEYRENSNPGCEKNSAILMTEFTLLETQVRSLDWPKKSVLTLGEGNNAEPISKAEMENREWNNKYDVANDEEKLQMQREALERFKEMPLPSANAIKNSGARKYIITNLRNYYDLTKRALPYYKRLLANPGNDPISQEIQNDAVLRARITYLEAIDRYINYRLRRDHQIVYGENGFGFETDPQYRYNRDPRGRVRRQRKYGTGEDGRSQSNAEFTLLSNAFTAFQAAMRGEGAAQNNPPQQPVQVQGGIVQEQEVHNFDEMNQNQVVNIIFGEEQFNQPGPEDIIVAKNTVKNIVNLFENKGKNNKNIINENNNNIINVEEDEKEDKKEKVVNKLKSRVDIFEKKEDIKEDVKENPNKINIIKEDVKENLNKINVIIEDKKEDIKEDIKNKINILDKKEEKINIIKEDKAEFLYFKEGKKNYIVTPEQEEEYQEYHKKQPRINRRIFNVKVVSKKVKALKYIEEYKKLFENCSDEIRSVRDNSAASTIDRDLQCMLKPVLLDSKGNPVTEADKIKHQWNKDFFNCWQKDKVDAVKAEKMIAEYLPHVYDQADEVMKIVKKNSKNQKKMMAGMEKYFESLLNDEKRLYEFYTMTNVGLSIDNFKNKIKSVGNFYETNKKFKLIGDAVGMVVNLFETYLTTHYGLDMTREGLDFVCDDNEIAHKAKQSKKSYEYTVDALKLIYNENKEVFDKETSYDFYAKEEKNTEVKKEKNKNVINENVKNENVIIEKKKEKKVDPEKEFKIKIIKTYSDAMSVHKSVRLNKAIKQAFKLNILDTNELDSKNALAPLLDSLNYKVTDKINLREKGDTEQDEKIRLSNESWAKLWTSNTPEKVKAREAMIAEKLPKIFDGVSLPTIEELKSGAVFDQKDGSKKLFDLYNIIRKVRGLQVLANVSKTAANICNNEVFKNKTKVITNLDLYLSQYLRDNYNMKETDEGLAAYKSLSYTDDDVDSDVVLKEYEKFLKSDWDKKIVITEMKEEPKNEINENKINENVINENKINENKINKNVINENKIIEKKAKVSGVNKAYVSEDTIAEYKKIYPELSEDAIKIIKGYKHVISMKYNPAYIELVKKGGKGLAGGAASASIDRVASYIMRPVEFDENSVPVNTKENLANHEWNLKWLKSWEEIKDYTQEEAIAKKAQKTGKKINKVKLTQEELDEIEAENEKRRQRREENQKIRKAMIEEESKKMWEGFELPPISESEELTEKDVTEYRKKLDKWIDEHVTKDPVKYYTLLSKFPAMDRLYKQSDDLKRVFKREPARHQLEKFVSDVNNYVIFYLQTKYHVDIEQSGLGVIIKPDGFANVEKAVGSMSKVVAQITAESGLAYKKMRDESKFVSVDVTQLKKMHEGNAIIADAKKDIELKKEIAGNLTETIEAVNNEKIALRRKVDIKDKKKLDFKTFEKLSQFGTLFGNNADLANYCALYGEGMKKQKVSKDKTAGNKEIFEVMEKLTGVIDKFDLKNINVSTDEYLTLYASDLEKMSGAVYAYNDLLMQNPDYLEKLKKDKAIDEKAFPNRAEEVVDKAVKLSAVADYYRARKLVITDELYTSKLNSQISYQSTKEDGTQMRRLKKFMRASYVAALNLGRVFGEKIPKLPDVQPESEDEKAIFDNLYRDAEKVETEKKERIEKEKQQKDSKNKNEIIEEDKKLKNKLDINMDIKDSMLAKLDALLVRDKQIKRLENERLFQAPLWMQNALTLDPKKIPDKLQTKGVKNPFFAIDSEKFGAQRLHLQLQEPKTKSLDEKRRAVLKEMTGSESYGSSPRFVNDDVKYLNKIDVSDSWNRTQVAFATEYMYGKCEEEIVELTELMKIQESKKWKDEKGNEHSKNWDKIKEDKDAFEFYKSAFIELSKKLFYSVYASAKRTAETYGLKALILHPTDLINQMTYELRKNITTTSVITNIVDNRNTKGKSRQDTVKQLFDDFDDGTYNLDIEDFLNVSGLVASLGLKIHSTTLGIVNTAVGEDDDIEDIEEKSKAIFGNADFFNEVVEPEYNKYIKKHKLINGKVDGIFSPNDQNQMVAWFLNHHPEYINRKALNAKYGEEGALQQFISEAYTSPFANNEYDIVQSIKKKSIDVPSQEELDKYEKHLEKEEYPKARTKYESCNGVFLKPNDKFRVMDVKGNVIGMETNKLKLDAREKDPYGVKLFKTNFSELDYVDKEGKKHFRVGV